MPRIQCLSHCLLSQGTWCRWIWPLLTVCWSKLFSLVIRIGISLNRRPSVGGLFSHYLSWRMRALLGWWLFLGRDGVGIDVALWFTVLVNSRSWLLLSDVLWSDILVEATDSLMLNLFLLLLNQSWILNWSDECMLILVICHSSPWTLWWCSLVALRVVVPLLICILVRCRLILNLLRTCHSLVHSMSLRWYTKVVLSLGFLRMNVVSTLARQSPLVLKIIIAFR
jgi:hypothetical protein